MKKVVLKPSGLPQTEGCGVMPKSNISFKFVFVREFNIIFNNSNICLIKNLRFGKAFLKRFGG